MSRRGHQSVCLGGASGRWLLGDTPAQEPGEREKWRESLSSLSLGSKCARCVAGSLQPFAPAGQARGWREFCDHSLPRNKHLLIPKKGETIYLTPIRRESIPKITRDAPRRVRREFGLRREKVAGEGLSGCGWQGGGGTCRFAGLGACNLFGIERHAFYEIKLWRIAHVRALYKRN